MVVDSADVSGIDTGLLVLADDLAVYDGIREVQTLFNTSPLHGKRACALYIGKCKKYMVFCVFVLKSHAL